VAAFERLYQEEPSNRDDRRGADVQLLIAGGAVRFVPVLRPPPWTVQSSSEDAADVVSRGKGMVLPLHFEAGAEVNGS
jgi:hypothetical protein